MSTEIYLPSKESYPNQDSRIYICYSIVGGFGKSYKTTLTLLKNIYGTYIYVYTHTHIRLFYSALSQPLLSRPKT